MAAHEDFTHLFWRVRTRYPGWQHAEEQLLRAYDPIAFRAAKKYCFALPGSAVEDLLQAGREALVVAIRQFDSTRGCRFSTFAWKAINGAVTDEYRRLTSAPIPFSALSADESSENAIAGFANAGPADCNDDALCVRAFVSSLSHRDQHVVIEKHWNGRSDADVARELRCTRAAIGQRLRRIYRRGRNALSGCSVAAN